MNTAFEHHTRYMYTWVSPDQYKNQIDYILVNSRWRSSVRDSKTYPGATCGSDHQLLYAEFKLKFSIPRKKRARGKFFVANISSLEHLLFKPDIKDTINNNINNANNNNSKSNNNNNINNKSIFIRIT